MAAGSDVQVHPRDLVETAVRAVVLYSLTEFQGGNATTIRVTKDGPGFSVADDGRGHPLDKELEGVSRGDGNYRAGQGARRGVHGRVEPPSAGGMVARRRESASGAADVFQWP